MSHSLEDLQSARRLAVKASDKAKLDRLIQVAEWKRVVSDPLYFFQHLALTKNEHITDIEADPYQPFPKHDYVREMVRLMAEEDRLVIPKSRQVMMSWLATTFALWWCLTHRAQLVLVQSKKEDDAGKLLERAFGVYNRLPGYIKDAHPCIQKSKPPELKFPSTDSSILGIPEGADQIRSNTSSMWIADESAFQPAFADAFIAAQPALEGGGRGMILSSARSGRMYEIVSDPMVSFSRKVLVQSWAARESVCRHNNGLETWKTTTGWTIAKLHYSADPLKDKEWAEKAAIKYGRQGMLSPGWQAEMEIDPGANLGKRVYSEFGLDTHVIPHFVGEDGKPTREPPDEWPVFLGLDWGVVDPCAVVFMALDGDHCWYIYDEIYVRGRTPELVSKIIKQKLGRREPETIWIGHDAAQVQASGDTVQDMFADHRILTETSYSKIIPKITRVNELLRLRLNGEPSLKVLEGCVNTIFEFQNYRYPDRTLEQLLKKDAGEKPQDKDDHAMDAMGNVVMNVDTGYARRWRGVESRRHEWSTIPAAARRKVASRRRLHDDGQKQYWD